MLRLFAIHNILSAPIFEANSSRCSGFLDLVDILQAVLSWFNVRPENCERADKLKRAGRKLLTERIRSIKLANDGHLVYRNGASTTLLEVCSVPLSMNLSLTLSSPLLFPSKQGMGTIMA